MKVLHISYNVVPQSAALRVHEALLSLGVDSYIYVLSPSSGHQRILYGRKYSLCENSWRKVRMWAYRFWERGVRRLFCVDNLVPISLGVGSLLDRRFLLDFKPDVVNLHWICGNFLSADDVVWLSKNFKVVWTLHDSWAFTGGCHVPQTCTKWKTGCKDCPYISKRFGIDLAKWIFQRKVKKYARADFKVIGVSNWIADCARKSVLLGDKPVFVAHNTLNQEIFKPHNKSVMRELLGLQQNTKLILFGAMNSTSDANKGFDLLYAAIRQVVEQKMVDNFELMVFGSDESENSPSFGTKVHYMGRLKDNLSLAVLYSAADVMIVPSRSECFPNTALESINCGTPVVAFRIGGIPEQIDHKVNGYLAKPYDSRDLAQGIAYILEDNERWTKMSRAARSKAVEHFNEKLIATEMVKVYEKAVADKKGR